MKKSKEDVLRHLDYCFNDFNRFRGLFKDLSRIMTLPFSLFEDEKTTVKRIIEDVELPDWTIYYKPDAIGELLEIFFQAMGMNFNIAAIRKGDFALQLPNKRQMTPQRMAVRLRKKQVEIFLRLKALINDLTCVMTTSKSIIALIPEAQKGNLKSLKTLLEVDRSILTTPWCQQIVRRAQLLQDREVLQTIAKALDAKTPIGNKQHLALAVFIKMYWHSGLNELSNPERFEFFRKHGLYGTTDDTSDPENLRKFIDRLKLNKQ